MKIEFEKYQGTGNDFIMIDNIDGRCDDLSVLNIQEICNRKFGVGADGLIKISASSGFDFEVEYYNSDGTQSFCGNGARCSVAFADSLGLVKDDETKFLAIDGEHKAFIKDNVVRLEMLPVPNYERVIEDYVLNTGSPHYVKFLDGEEQDIVVVGKRIRYSEKFKDEGINVNLVKVLSENSISVETYERGVEDETLSCGTGVTACALMYMLRFSDSNLVEVKTKGGILTIESDSYDEASGFKNIWLSGPAKKVYDGSIVI